MPSKAPRAKLARQLAACEQWPETHPAPVRGSLGARFSRLPDGYRDVVTGFRWETLGGGVFVPRLDDDATVGCLEGMVDRLAGINLHGTKLPLKWRVSAPVEDGPGDGSRWVRCIGVGLTRGEAVACALLEQWGVAA